MTNKTFALAVRYQQLGVEAENVLYIQKITAGDPTVSQMQAIANNWKEGLRTSQSSSVAWVDFVATQVCGPGVTFETTRGRQVGGLLFTGLLTGTLAGVNAADPLPPLAAISLRCQTGLRGRPYRTHKQLGGWCEDAQSGGVWGAGFLSALGTALNTAFNVKYQSGGTDPDFRFVTFSRGIASGWYPDPDLRHHPLRFRGGADQDAATAVITTVTLTNVVSTMRSRMV